MLVELAEKQAINEMESIEFKNTALWVIQKFENLISISKLAQIFKSPTHSFENISTIYTSSSNLYKYAKISMLLNKTSTLYYKKDHLDLLKNVLEELGK